jgi:ABC-2 type transport system ATP-binding protein
MAAISVRGLTKQFGAITAVDDLSFEVKEGTITGFRDPTARGRRPRCGCCSV